jgi:hypothetical protein
MAKYPNEIYEPREKENRSGVTYDPNKKTVIFAEDIKNLDDEIVAIETELGTNPKGTFNSVKEFLQHLLSKVKDYFTDLLDTPDSYEGQAGKAVVVKETEDGLEFKDFPAPGVSTFLDLTDTPDSYEGQAGKAVIVKETEDGLKFGAPSGAGIEKGWELIKTGEFTNSFNITNLDGDTDKLWLLIIRARHTAVFYPSIRFNGDNGTNYKWLRHYAGYSGGSKYHDIQRVDNMNIIQFSWADDKEFFIRAFISAKSGQKRIVSSHLSAYTNFDNNEIIDLIATWENTTDNITTINVITGAITAGEYWLFRKKE